DPSLTRWFNTEAGFNKVSAQQLGSNVRTFALRIDSVRADGVANMDLSVLKNVAFSQGHKLQFRFEAINALNHAQFPAPGLGVTAAGFGQVVTSAQQNYPRRVQIMVKYLF